MSVREIIAEPTGRQKDAVLRAAKAKRAADMELRAVMARRAEAIQRMHDVLECLTGQDPTSMIVDPETGCVYKAPEGDAPA